MNKRFVIFSVLIMAGIVLAACSPALTEQVLVNNPSTGQQTVSLNLHTTQAPPAIPTIVINPTPAPGGGGFALPYNRLMILVYVLIAAVVVITLVALLRKGS